MKYTHDDIRNAFNVIINVCKNYTKGNDCHDCEHCPFGNKEGDCFFFTTDNSPNYWSDHTEENLWRAVYF